MTTLRWLLALAAGLATTLPAGAGDPYSVRDVDSSPVKELSLDVSQVELFQSENNRMVFKVTFAAPPDIGRLRVLLDVDGPGRGEPGSGADYMLEGASFYRYPKGATDWTWDAIEPPFTLVEGRTVTCMLPDVPDLAAVTDPLQYVGRAPQQVDEFLAEVVDPIRAKYAGDVGAKAEVRV